MAWHRADPTCQRLETIPGIGFITATALAATRKCSVPAGSLPLGSAWCQRSTRPAASCEWAYRKWETAICGISLSLEPLPSFGIRGTRRLPSASGQINCWSENQPVWSLSLSPTRWHGSPGRLWLVKRAIAPCQPECKVDRYAAGNNQFGQEKTIRAMLIRSSRRSGQPGDSNQKRGSKKTLAQRGPSTHESRSGRHHQQQMARSVGSLRRSDTSGVGGEADMPRTLLIRRD